MLFTFCIVFLHNINYFLTQVIIYSDYEKLNSAFQGFLMSTHGNMTFDSARIYS